MKFCTQCGGPVSIKIPQDDNRERYVCDDCGFIHYHNPNAVVGTLPYCGYKVLLCKRGIEPRKGLTLIWPAEWTHSHRGNILTSGVKYIITGWLIFPNITEWKL